MTITRRLTSCAAALLIAAACAAARAADAPETVMITLRPKPGSEAELARVIAKHWETAHSLKLLKDDTPHVTLRGTESGQVYFVDVFTWRDADTPDNAPAPILAIWAEMSRLVDARDGHPGIDIRPMSLVR